MRNTEERVAAVKQRAKTMERQKKMRRKLIVSISPIALSFFLIVGLALWMPGLMASLPGGGYTHSGAAGGIFDGGSSLGYIFVGVLAFLLGVSVTIFSYLISLRNKENHRDAEDKDG